MRTMARNLIAMHFISLQLSLVSGKKKKKQENVISSKIKRIITKDACTFTTTSRNINIL